MSQLAFHQFTYANFVEMFTKTHSDIPLYLHYFSLFGNCCFFFITLPEALPIAVITRFVEWFHDFGIPVGGVIVNMMIDKSLVTDDAAEFVRSRVRMQTEHMETIRQKFTGQVRAVLPLLETEIRGVPMIGRAADLLFV